MIRNSSYVNVSDVPKDAKAHCDELKKKGVGAYLTFKVDNGILVSEDTISGVAKTPKDLVLSLPTDDCRFVVYNYESNLIFLDW